MRDNDEIYKAIDGLRRELREDSEWRARVDKDFRAVHKRIDGINAEIDPIRQFAGNQKFLAKVGAWVIATLIAVGALVIAALKTGGQ